MLLFYTSILFLTYIQVIVFNGCAVASLEGNLPLINMKPTELIKKVLFIEKMDTNDMEKLFVGTTLAAFIGKTSIVMTTKYLYKAPFHSVLKSFDKYNIIL
jgi:hypothetical protein